MEGCDYKKETKTLKVDLGFGKGYIKIGADEFDNKTADEVKFGNKLHLGGINSQEDAEKAKAEFLSQFRYSDEQTQKATLDNYKELSAQTLKNDALQGLGQQVYQLYDYLVPQWLGQYEPAASDKMYYTHTENKSIMTGKEADAVYGFVKEAYLSRLENGTGKKLETPYQKIPLKDRVANKIYKVTGSKKFNPDIEMHAKLEGVYKEVNKYIMDGGNSGSNYLINFPDVANKIVPASEKASEMSYRSGAEYLKDLVSRPHSETIAKLKNDYAIVSAKEKNLKEPLEQAEKKVKDMFIQNTNYENISKAVDGKLEHHLKILPKQKAARLVLAQRGMMANEDVRAANPKHPSVKMEMNIVRNKVANTR